MSNTDIRMHASVFPQGFWLAFGLNFLWINLSEVFRYFAFVMPMMREALAVVPEVAPMNFTVFMIWGVWDTVLVFATTFVCWVVLERFGPSFRSAIKAGTLVWATVFVILWLGLYNMNLATPAMLVALPLAWIEMVVAAFIVRWVFQRNGV